MSKRMIERKRRELAKDGLRLVTERRREPDAALGRHYAVDASGNVAQTHVEIQFDPTDPVCEEGP